MLKGGVLFFSCLESCRRVLVRGGGLGVFMGCLSTGFLQMTLSVFMVLALLAATSPYLLVLCLAAMATFILFTVAGNELTVSSLV